MNKAGKSPPPVQTNRNINNPPPILTFKFCIRLAAPCQIQVLLVCNHYSIAKFHFLPVQFYVILSALKNYLWKMTQQCFGEKWYLVKTGCTPVIPLALIVHVFLLINNHNFMGWNINIKIVKSQERVRNLGLWLLY